MKKERKEKEGMRWVRPSGFGPPKEFPSYAIATKMFLYSKNFGPQSP